MFYTKYGTRNVVVLNLIKTLKVINHYTLLIINAKILCTEIRCDKENVLICLLFGRIM